ncbi:MAG: hypothetical protein M3Y77_04935 [Actinomycetota bacterium]|nr:hypothetical protein [Actinomycetota bacterium]
MLAVLADATTSVLQRKVARDEPVDRGFSLRLLLDLSAGTARRGPSRPRPGVMRSGRRVITVSTVVLPGDRDEGAVDLPWT